MGSRNGFKEGTELGLAAAEGISGEFRGTVPYPAAPPDIAGTPPPASASSLPRPTAGS